MARRKRRSDTGLGVLMLFAIAVGWLIQHPMAAIIVGGAVVLWLLGKLYQMLYRKPLELNKQPAPKYKSRLLQQGQPDSSRRTSQEAPNMSTPSRPPFRADEFSQLEPDELARSWSRKGDSLGEEDERRLVAARVGTRAVPEGASRLEAARQVLAAAHAAVRSPVFDSSTRSEDRWDAEAGLWQSKPVAAWIWHPPGKPVDIMYRTLPDGMVYIRNIAIKGPEEADACLIDPSLAVDERGVVPEEEKKDYWPRYGRLSPGARSAYLGWLEGGRRGPADIAFPFLFMAGLERRVVVDGVHDPESVLADLPAIRAEVAALLATYGRHHSIKRYATSFLKYIDAFLVAKGNYSPQHISAAELSALSPEIRLSWHARHGGALDWEWALDWVLGETESYRPISCVNHPDLFRQLFKLRFEQKFGASLPPPKTVPGEHLCVGYLPASGTIRRTKEIDTGLPLVIDPGDLKYKIVSLINNCDEELSGYTQLASARNGEVTLGDAALLPHELWPDALRAVIHQYVGKVDSGPTLISLDDLSSALGEPDGIGRSVVLGLAEGLDAQGYGIEPDVFTLPRWSRSLSHIAIFRQAPKASQAKRSVRYEPGFYMTEMSVAMALADGTISPEEQAAILRHINSWPGLKPAERTRLAAVAMLAEASPTSTTTLKKKLELVPIDDRRSIAKLLVAMAHSDGTVTWDEAKLLRKQYAMLGLPEDLANEDLGVPKGFEVRPPATRGPKKSGGSVPAPVNRIKIDPAKLAALQAESKTVSHLLAKVFADDDEDGQAITSTSPAKPAPAAVATAPSGQAAAKPIWGLDAKHSEFAHRIIDRAAWARHELEAVAKTFGLYVDGAIERINDAALDAVGATLLDGEDPIDVDPGVREQLAQAEVSG